MCVLSPGPGQFFVALPFLPGCRMPCRFPTIKLPKGRSIRANWIARGTGSGPQPSARNCPEISPVVSAAHSQVLMDPLAALLGAFDGGKDILGAQSAS